MANANDRTGLMDSIKQGINQAIKVECGKDFDLFVEDLKKRKEQIVAGIALNLFERLSYIDDGRVLRIEIVKQ